MRPEMMGVELKRFETPDEVRVFHKGRIEIVRIGSRIVGRATYEPGWKWSEHVGSTTQSEDQCPSFATTLRTIISP
jgi:hypothetical protein